MENEKQKEFILNGNLWKVIFDLSWPAVIAMILLGANNVLDGIFVGHFAEEGAFAGISVALPPVITIIGLGILVGSGAGTLSSIAIGAEDKKVQKNILGNVNFLTLIISVIVMSLGFIFSEQTLFLMGGRGKALIHGGEYYLTLLWGTPIWIYAIALNNLIRSEGKMKTAAAIMGISLIVNGCANYILMVIFSFGVKGAAIGTNIGMAVQACIGAYYFAKKNTDSPAYVFTIRMDGEIISKIISMGLAGFIMQFMGTIQMLLVLNVLNRYGSQEDIAFYGIVTRIFSFVLQPIGGFMFALSPIIGINFGADKTERLISAFKRFVFAALVLIAPLWILMIIFPQTAVSLMMKNPHLSIQNISYFRIYMALLPIMPLVFFALAFFPAVNKGKISSILGILQQIVFYIPVMLIFPIFIGVAGVYYGTFFIEVLSGIPVSILLLREFRLLRTGITKWQKNEEMPLAE
ncbi:polysaccharide biosynthesis C-terminal domain-containing protein [Treponema sp. OMZ 792]|uniref:MATE family efflux transporter n=1 Tax=unclassified Treponema TaxID=2638727 RepID=UPI0020A5A22E|nr:MULTISPECIES: MATE family efflux transporter [unclassified Treponema]UTC75393.1 polysaccharide biosynthesis C-terminal domain-containing protein [Treponema sp. OMZ 792]UTC79396.1 multidrug transporter MatE [Treponema sp. OMZ 798]